MTDATPKLVPEMKPNPDPTVATNEAVERAVEAERDYVDGQIAVLLERLRGIDKATELLGESASQVPEHIAKVVHHLRELMEEKFASVSNQFKERDTRSEREARDNKLAVDAAFAAQEKQAVAQNESNTLAISKSEASTAETIKTNQDLSRSTTDGLTKSLDEVKLQVSRIESVKQGGMESRTERRAATSNTTTVIASVVGAIVLVLSAISLYAMANSNETPAAPIVVPVPSSTTP